jgi:hypothetical protein
MIGFEPASTLRAAVARGVGFFEPEPDPTNQIEAISTARIVAATSPEPRLRSVRLSNVDPMARASGVLD